MPFIAPELIIQAKQMDLLTYLKNYEPYELVKFSGNTYCTRTHDSLKISNGKWIWWSRGIGGRSALDYLIKVKGYSFLEAVETIIGHTAIQAPVYEKPQPKEENKPLLLPEKCASNRVITEYLFGRGIDFEIINYCISNDLIFESLPYHNVVFVGYDEKKEPKYAAYRSTNKRRIMGDCSGSKKDYSFRLGKENLEEVHLFECAIDLLSYATLAKLNGQDWKEMRGPSRGAPRTTSMPRWTPTVPSPPGMSAPRPSPQQPTPAAPSAPWKYNPVTIRSKNRCTTICRYTRCPYSKRRKHGRYWNRTTKKSFIREWRRLRR